MSEPFFDSLNAGAVNTAYSLDSAFKPFDYGQVLSSQTSSSSGLDFKEHFSVPASSLSTEPLFSDPGVKVESPDWKENVQPSTAENDDITGSLLVDPVTGEPVSEQRQIQAETKQDVKEEEIDPAEMVPGVVLNIAINNVVCSFALRCHLNLRRIATEGSNVYYRRENGMVVMKLRKPSCTASIWSSGKVTVTGATSEESAYSAARRIGRILQKMGFRVRLVNYRVVNVLGTCNFPFGIRISHFSRDHPQDASYEPELHPGVTYKLKSPKATLKIFSTGSITVTAPRVDNVESAITHIYPLVKDYQMEPRQVGSTEMSAVQSYQQGLRNSFLYKRRTCMQGVDSDSEDEDELDDISDECCDSDEGVD